MNSDILAGKWTQLRGQFKENFGRLTHDDLVQIEGSSDRIVGIPQQRYSYDELSHSAAKTLRTLADKVEETV